VPPTVNTCVPVPPAAVTVLESVIVPATVCRTIGPFAVVVRLDWAGSVTPPTPAKALTTWTVAETAPTVTATAMDAPDFTDPSMNLKAAIPASGSTVLRGHTITYSNDVDGQVVIDLDSGKVTVSGHAN